MTIYNSIYYKKKWKVLEKERKEFQTALRENSKKTTKSESESSIAEVVFMTLTLVSWVGT